MKKVSRVIFAVFLLLQVILLAAPISTVRAQESKVTAYVFRRKFNQDIETTNTQYEGLNGVTYTIYDISEYYQKESSSHTDKDIAEKLKNLNEDAVKSTTGVTNSYGTAITQTITTAEHGTRDGVAKACLDRSDSKVRAYLFVETDAPSGTVGTSLNVMVTLKTSNTDEEIYCFPKTYLPTPVVPPGGGTPGGELPPTGTESTDTESTNTESTETRPTDTRPTDTVDGSTNSDMTTSSTIPTKGQKEEGKLPSTGEKMNYVLMLLGGGLILAVTVLLKLEKERG